MSFGEDIHITEDEVPTRIFREVTRVMFLASSDGICAVPGDQGACGTVWRPRC